MERHVGMRLLGEGNPSEVHVQHAAADGIAADVVDQRRHLGAAEPGQRKQGGISPAAVGKLERVLVGFDRRRVSVTAENDTRQQTLAAKGVDLLTEDLARADAQLLGFGHDGLLPESSCGDLIMGQGGVGKSRTTRKGPVSSLTFGHARWSRPVPQSRTRSKSSTSLTSLMSGVVGFISTLPVKLAVPFGFWVEAFWNRAPNSAFPLM